MATNSKPKVIYVVTTMTFGVKYLNSRKSADGYFHSYEKRTSKKQKEFFSILRERTWGWYASLEEAEQSVLKNWTDLNECGYYEHALIEEIQEGVLYGGATPKEWWFCWKGSFEKGGYKPTNKPKEYSNIIGFMGRVNPRKSGS
jgi:hypothetical protein